MLVCNDKHSRFAYELYYTFLKFLSEIMHKRITQIALSCVVDAKVISYNIIWYQSNFSLNIVQIIISDISTWIGI